MLTIEQIKELVSHCKFEDWDINVRMDGDRPYLQIHVLNGKDADTGERVPDLRTCVAHSHVPIEAWRQLLGMPPVSQRKDARR